MREKIVLMSHLLCFFRKRKLEEVSKHETLPVHPNCVRFYKAWEEKQHLYIQTELCETRYKVSKSLYILIWYLYTSKQQMQLEWR